MCSDACVDWMLQEPYRRVHFQLVESDTAAFFILDSNTGQLQLRSSLLHDPDLADVYDVSTPSRYIVTLK